MINIMRRVKFPASKRRFSNPRSLAEAGQARITYFGNIPTMHVNKCNASHMCRLLKFFVVPVPNNRRVTGNRLGGAIINHSIDDIASVAQFAIIVADGVDCERYAELSSSICPVTQLNIRIE